MPIFKDSHGDEWDVDITAATGTHYLGLMESLGASNILAFWLD